MTGSSARAGRCLVTLAAAAPRGHPPPPLRLGQPPWAAARAHGAQAAMRWPQATPLRAQRAGRGTRAVDHVPSRMASPPGGPRHHTPTHPPAMAITQRCVWRAAQPWSPRVAWPSIQCRLPRLRPPPDTLGHACCWQPAWRAVWRCCVQQSRESSGSGPPSPPLGTPTLQPSKASASQAASSARTCTARSRRSKWCMLLALHARGGSAQRAPCC